ncbi:MAG: hypothetical protein ACI4I5_06545 [Acutalibacteraceae bacterium]
MRKCKRVAALLLSAALLVGAAGCGAKQTQAPVTEPVEPAAAPVRYTEKPGSLRKAETVYVNLDNSGKKLSVGVTDWLHTDKGEVAVEDVSDLQNITDIKGNFSPVQNGKNLTWHMTDTDLYYTGTTDKQLPVEFAVEYKLDGKKISPEKIVGKSGEVEIRVQMKNVCQKDGVYLPVIAAGLLILPENVFSGIEVANGLSVGDGAKQIIVGLGVPGMAESLELRENAKLGGISLGDSFTVTAQTESFALDNMYFAVLPLCSADLSTLIPDSEAQAASFFAQVENILQALGHLDVQKLTQALSGQNVANLADLLSEAVTTYKKNEALLQVLGKYMTAENIENISALITALQDPDTVKMLETLNNPVMKRLLSGTPELLSSIEALTPMLTQLQEDLQDPDIQQSLKDLPQTMQTLSKLQKAMDDNSELLDALGDIADSDLLGTLSDRSDAENAQTLLGDLTENADTLLPKLKAYIAFGEEYGLFTDAAEGTQISLMFIYMTPSLHPETQTAETTTEVQEPWYKKIF